MVFGVDTKQLATEYLIVGMTTRPDTFFGHQVRHVVLPRLVRRFAKRRWTHWAKHPSRSLPVREIQGGEIPASQTGSRRPLARPIATSCPVAPKALAGADTHRNPIRRVPWSIGVILRLLPTAFASSDAISLSPALPYRHDRTRERTCLLYTSDAADE